MKKTKFERLNAAALDQDNVVTRKQLCAFRFSDDQIGTMVHRKYWTQLQAAAFLLSPGPATWRQQARATQWAGGKGVALDAGSALLWWGCDGPTPGDIELTRTGATGGPTPRDAVVRRPTRAITVRKSEGVQVVGIEDALLGFAAMSKDRRAVEVAVESALLSHKTSERKIWQAIGRNSRKGVRGVALLRHVMEHRPEGKPSRSMLELEVLDVLRKSGVPLPARNVDVIDGNGDKREIDLCYLTQKGAIEADSKRWHSTASQKADDRRRQRALEAVGFEFVRVTWSDVFDRPEWVIDQVRRLLLRIVAA